MYRNYSSLRIVQVDNRKNNRKNRRKNHFFLSSNEYSMFLILFKYFLNKYLYFKLSKNNKTMKHAELVIYR